MQASWRKKPEPISEDQITRTLTADIVILGRRACARPGQRRKTVRA